jgi:hypothetical protein
MKKFPPEDEDNIFVVRDARFSAGYDNYRFTCTKLDKNNKTGKKWLLFNHGLTLVNGSGSF